MLIKFIIIVSTIFFIFSIIVIDYERPFMPHIIYFAVGRWDAFWRHYALIFLFALGAARDISRYK